MSRISQTRHLKSKNGKEEHSRWKKQLGQRHRGTGELNRAPSNRQRSVPGVEHSWGRVRDEPGRAIEGHLWGCTEMKAMMMMVHHQKGVKEKWAQWWHCKELSSSTAMINSSETSCYEFTSYKTKCFCLFFIEVGGKSTAIVTAQLIIVNISSTFC